MRHTPCGCRSAHLVEVHSNHRLPKHSTMRRAPAMPLFRTQSAAKQTSLAPHDSKARLRVVTKCRDSWRSHVHRTHTAQRVQSFKLKTANVRGQGGSPPCLSLGVPKGVFSLEREYPLCSRRPQAAFPSVLCAEKTIPPARQPPFTPLGVKQLKGVLCQKSS